ncbi:hypothetical protein CDA63_07555 [Hymenobacter amundsenii]|uniref:Uncharacterized protein n=1 Tax=Hymenobacter amundsenii TaxID=2006685 RepID=A0A246FLP1_9BACT|nr:hypothetical protein [Hymenobacter amundsenii]OWP63640.1 hypothetical protein CDA63_07555 [Hymenobacter amundsenii]
MTSANKIIIKDNKLSYEQDPQNRWTLDIDKIKFVGEYTTSAGPLADDWFFVFADTIDQWWQAPTLAVDHEKFWKQLGEKLNCELVPGLFASTNFATRVIYPKILDGQELFVFAKTEVRPKTFWQKIIGVDDNNEHLELTENVKMLFK